jgi:hypothetical protein
MMGCFILVRHSHLVAKEGIILCVVFTILCALLTTLTAISLEALFNNNSRLSQSTNLFNILRMNLGKELASSICIIHFCGKILLTAVFCLAAAETILWDSPSYEYFDHIAMKHQSLSILILSLIVLVLFIKKRLFFSMLLYIIVAIAILTYLSVMLGISINSGLNTSLFQHISAMKKTIQVSPDSKRVTGIDSALSLILPAYLGITGSTQFIYSNTNYLMKSMKKKIYNRASALTTMINSIVVLTLSLMIIIAHGTLLSREILEKDNYITCKLILLWVCDIFCIHYLYVYLRAYILHIICHRYTWIHAVVTNKSFLIILFLQIFQYI